MWSPELFESHLRSCKQWTTPTFGRPILDDRPGERLLGGGGVVHKGKETEPLT
jgi:hypothetical protein